jgi:uncharacterized protein (DUF1778 family)
MKTRTSDHASTARQPDKRTVGLDVKRKAVTKNLRIDADMSRLIEQAAASTGMTFTSFVLEAAAARAERYLLDKCFITVDAHAFDEVEKLLDDDHRPTERLRALFKTKDSNSEEVNSNNNYAEVRLGA